MEHLRNGLWRISLDAALALSREFGVSLDWIYTGVWSRPLPQNLRDKIREIEPAEEAAPTFLDLYPEDPRGRHTMTASAESTSEIGKRLRRLRFAFQPEMTLEEWVRWVGLKIDPSTSEQLRRRPPVDPARRSHAAEGAARCHPRLDLLRRQLNAP